MTRHVRGTSLSLAAGLGALVLTALGVPVMGHEGNIDGAIFTSTNDGTVVNENTRYGGKNEVYLNVERNR